MAFFLKRSTISPLQDPVTWYGINYAGTQTTQWDFQNKGKLGWTGKSSFVLEVPLRHLRPSVIYSVPCDWILQRAYFGHYDVVCLLLLTLPKTGFASLKICEYWTVVELPSIQYLLFRGIQSSAS